jgi:AcrR family transcriptional regulator
MATRRAALREPRVPLTRDRVVRAAIDLADDAGIEALSMRRLGQALGVEAMSLYNHVANKDDILNAIVEIVESDIELPQPGADWKPALRRTAISAHDVLERHPWAASLAGSAIGPRPVRWRYMNAILGCLREAGFSAEMTDRAYHSLESHIAGFTLWASQMDIDEEAFPDLAATFLRELPEDLPYLVEHVHQHLKERDAAGEGTFAFGLDLILDGLERFRRQAPRSQPKRRPRTTPPTPRPGGRRDRR